MVQRLIVVVRFGDQRKQWNAAFDDGRAPPSATSLALYSAEHDRALKEMDATTSAVARTPEQVVQALAYVTRGVLPKVKTQAAEWALKAVPARWRRRKLADLRHRSGRV